MPCPATQVVSLLKIWLEMLPEPLVPTAVQPALRDVLLLKGPEKQLERLVQARSRRRRLCCFELACGRRWIVPRRREQGAAFHCQ